MSFARSQFAGNKWLGITGAVLAGLLIRDLLSGIAQIVVEFVLSFFPDGAPNFFADGIVDVNGRVVELGPFLVAVVSIAIAILVIRLWGAALMAAFGGCLQSAPSKECPRCLSSIPERATRCRYCTSEIGLA